MTNNKKILYKVLKEDMTSPFQGFITELNKEYCCPCFDEDATNDCSNGFYATELEGIIYSFRKNARVFEAEMSGKEVKFDKYKHRFEKQKLIREIFEPELRELMKNKTKDINFNLEEVCFPINPLNIKRTSDILSPEEIKDLMQWNCIGKHFFGNKIIHNYTEEMEKEADKIYSCLHRGLTDDIYEKVRYNYEKEFITLNNFELSCLQTSYQNLERAYLVSLLKNNLKDKIFEKNPSLESYLKCAVNLWKNGLVPLYDGYSWKVYAGEEPKIIYEYKEHFRKNENMDISQFEKDEKEIKK